jgi:hypothetical protein
MRSRLLILGLAVTFSVAVASEPPKPTARPFADLKWVKAVAYNFNLGPRPHDEVSIVAGGALHPTAVLPGVMLDEAQVRSLAGELTNDKTYGGPAASCFVPRLGVVFYDEHDAIVAHIDICFECNYMNSSFPIPASGYFYDGKEHYFRNGREVPFEQRGHEYGFNRRGRKRLVEWCRDLKLAECGKPSSTLFDQ